MDATVETAAEQRAARSPCPMMRRLLAWLQERRTRRALERLGDGVLKDIGVHRSEIAWVARSVRHGTALAAAARA